MSAALLIAPLRALVGLLGTGVLPPGALTGLHDAPRVLEAAAASSARGKAAVAAGWHGAGGEGAGRRSRTLTADDSRTGADGADVSGVVESAAGHVKRANTELNALVDSFVAAAASVPAVATPAGLAALVPLALDHLARGVRVVRRAQTELAADTERLARHRAPADIEAPVEGAPDTGPFRSAGTRIVLPDGSVVHAPNERAATAVRAALSVQGTPYVWGGTTTDGFDCSGFTQWAYRQAGVELPRLAQDQDLAGTAVAQSELQPGDLAVWSGHVAMFIGNGQFVETGGDPVGVTALRTTNAGQTFEGFYRPR